MPFISANNGHKAATFQFDYTSGVWLQMNGRAPNWPYLAGLLYGDGFFDTMAVWKGAIQLWEYHQAKLKETAQIIDVELPTQVLDALPGCVQGQEGVLRVYAVAQGVGEPHCWFATFTEQPLERPLKPIWVNMASRTIDAEDLAHRYKLLSRFTYRQAQREVVGDDALLLNKAGRVASFTSACVLYGMGGEAYAIPAEEGRQNSASLKGLQARCGVLLRPLEASLAAVEWMLAVNSLRLRVVGGVGGHTMPMPSEDVLGQYLPFWPWQGPLAR